MRALGLLVGTAFRADRRGLLMSLCSPLAALAYPLLAYWLKVIVDGRTLLGVSGLLGTIVARWAVDYFCTAVQATLVERVGFVFENEVLRLCSELPDLRAFEDPEFQDQLELLRQGQGSLASSLEALFQAVAAIISTGSTVVLLAAVHPILLLFLLLALPAIPVAAAQQRWRAIGERESAAPMRLRRHLRGLLLSGAGEPRVFGWEREIARRHRVAAHSAARPVISAQRRVVAAAAGQELLFAAAFAGAVGYMLWAATHGRASAGDVVLTVVLCRQAQQTVLWPVNSVASLSGALPTAKRLLWLRKAVPHSVHAETPVAGEIALDRVSFSYPGAARPAIHDFSARLRTGSVVALVGENGSGKSTLVKLLCGLYRPSGGTITAEGAPLDRPRISAAFQDFVRFELRSGHAVGIGDLPLLDDEKAIERALDRAGSALPTDIQLGSQWPGGVDLSTGQWQQLALARAMMRRDPTLLVLDEPTASLDAQTEHALFERYIDAAAPDEILLLVSHRFSTVRSADLILVLDEGRLLESGTHDELIVSGGRYAELFALQANAYR